jgi:hypothetical protein
MNAAAASIAIHMDSLGWAAGTDPRRQRDPTWFAVADRFLEIADARGIRFTFFVIARDLADPAVRERLRFMVGRGHEIASHSFAHPQDFGARPKAAMSDDVRRAHEAIAAAAGRAPVGFAAPAWNGSADLQEVLVEAGYRYAATTFPSWLMAAMLAKMWWNFRDHPRRHEVLRRRDAMCWLAGRRHPHRAGGPGAGGLVELPVPTTPYLRLPCWHTLALLLPPRAFAPILDRCLAAPAFMYVVHPLDLLGPADVPPPFLGGSACFERLDVPLHAKRRRFEDVLDRIASDGRSIVTCEALAAGVARGAEA